MTESGPTVTLPDSRQVGATKSAQLPLSNKLSLDAQKGHVLPDLTSSTLVSAGKLCDDGCDVVFRKDKVQAVYPITENCGVWP